MRFSHSISILAFLWLTFFLNACSDLDSANRNSSAANRIPTGNSNAAVTAQDDIEELGKIIKLPVEPEETTFIEIALNDKNSEPNLPAPNEKKLIAVLKFTAENAAQIIAQAEKQQAAAPADVDAEMWFPPELIAKSQETGDEYLKGTTYAANDFFQSPYLKGRLTRINDTNYFVLELDSL